MDISKPKDGGYCPMCDTVWASPGKCKCEPLSDKPSVLFPNLKNTEELKKEVWNAAIEAAAKEIESKSHICLPLIIRVRGLKK